MTATTANGSRIACSGTAALDGGRAATFWVQLQLYVKRVFLPENEQMIAVANKSVGSEGCDSPYHQLPGIGWLA